MCLNQMFTLQSVLLVRKRVTNHNVIDFCVKVHPRFKPHRCAFVKLTIFFIAEHIVDPILYREL